jgi:hypothetical protein
VTKDDIPIIIALGAMLLCVAFVVFWGIPEGERQDHEIWGHGYCAALNGSWLNAKACNVNGKVVTIPSAELAASGNEKDGSNG